MTVAIPTGRAVNYMVMRLDFASLNPKGDCAVGKMDRDVKIKSAIAEVIQNHGLFCTYDHYHHLTVNRARQVATSIFEKLDKLDYLTHFDLPTERQTKIINVITQGIGNFDGNPKDYSPGWSESTFTRDTPPSPDIIADAVYEKLVNRGYITS